MKCYWRLSVVRAVPMTIDEYKRRCARDSALPACDYAPAGTEGYLLDDYTIPRNPKRTEYGYPAWWCPKQDFERTYQQILSPYPDVTELSCEERVVTFKHETGDQLLTGVRLTIDDPVDRLYSRIATLGIPHALPVKVVRDGGVFRIHVLRYHPAKCPHPTELTAVLDTVTAEMAQEGVWLLWDADSSTIRLKSCQALCRRYVQLCARAARTDAEE